MDGKEVNVESDEEENTRGGKKSIHDLTHKLIVRLCTKPFTPPSKACEGCEWLFEGYLSLNSLQRCR